MSVYRPKNSRLYHYDFVFKGVRYHGSTGCAAKRDADAYERDRRTEAAIGTKAKPQITIDEACGLYWEHKGQHENNRATTKGQLARLVAGLGPTQLLGDLGFAAVNLYIAKRRGMKARNRGTLISNATVNREVELIRRVTKLADKSGYAVPTIAWGDLMLKEAQERVRELSDDEERRLLAKLNPDLAAVAEFALLSGQRRTAIISMIWSKVDLQAGRAEVLTKGNVWHSFPLSPRMVAIIANRPKVCAQVFTYECKRRAPKRADRAHRVKGERYPFSKQGWTREWRKALADAGIENFRFHDLRHTTGTRMLRQTGNIKVVAKLLAHSNIATTARYAHAIEDDVRNALLAVESRTIPEGDVVVGLNIKKKG